MEHISNLCARPSATLENLPGLIYFHDCCHSSEQMPGDNNDQKEHAPRLAFVPQLRNSTVSHCFPMGKHFSLSPLV